MRRAQEPGGRVGADLDRGPPLERVDDVGYSRGVCGAELAGGHPPVGGLAGEDIVGEILVGKGRGSSGVGLEGTGSGRRLRCYCRGGRHRECQKLGLLLKEVSYGCRIGAQ